MRVTLTGEEYQTVLGALSKAAADWFVEASELVYIDHEGRDALLKAASDANRLHQQLSEEYGPEV